jgi:hypothetical protein
LELVVLVFKENVGCMICISAPPAALDRYSTPPCRDPAPPAMSLTRDLPIRSVEFPPTNAVHPPASQHGVFIPFAPFRFLISEVFTTEEPEAVDEILITLCALCHVTVATGEHLNENVRRNPQVLLFGSFWGQLANERPRNFGSLAVVVVNEKTATGPIFDLKRFKLCFWRNLVCAANCRVRLKNTESVIELDVERVFPA